MAGPASPGTEGPTYEPPSLPPGWIAQWDGSSKKYYFVSISTGVSQWETPSQAAPGGTPAPRGDHPYGAPGAHPELITHPDGTQTIKHPDGRMEPVLPPEGARALESGPTGERGFGSFATNALMNQLSASQFLGGGHGNNNNSGHGNTSGGQGSGGGPAGKLVGALASSLFSSGGSGKPEQPQNYHGGQSHQPAQSGGFAGSVMGGVANMFGGNNQGHSSQNFGYSNTGSQGGYSGQAPPASYQPSSASTPAYSSSTTGQHTSQHGGAPSYGAQQHQQPQPHHTPSFPPPQHTSSYSSPPPNTQSHVPAYGSHPQAQAPGYGHSPVSQGPHYSHQPPYNTSPSGQHHQYNGGGHQQYPLPSQLTTPNTDRYLRHLAPILDPRHTPVETSMHPRYRAVPIPTMASNQVKGVTLVTGSEL
ncbi:ww domain-containing protein [Apiospora hydei]|uniref:Ww domain-containing protein n=1 Tax=Apiospora hydei TaxID=1337664 RepID=A0ABR1XE05_9PEZI